MLVFASFLGHFLHITYAREKVRQSVTKANVKKNKEKQIFLQFTKF